jgi:hypothetical protein
MNSVARIVSRISGSALFLTFSAHAFVAPAAGTITLANTTFTLMRQFQSPGSYVPLPASAPVVYGVFWGTDPSQLTLVPTLGINAGSGLISGPNPFRIPGTEAGQTVYLRICAWNSSYGTDWESARFGRPFSQTDIRQVTLGSDFGPGAIVWQSSAGTSLNRFYPMILGAPLTPSAYISLGFTPPDLIVDEGDTGTVDVTINVRRLSTTGSSLLDYPSSVRLVTSNITAVAGQDYVGTNVLITFAPGETNRAVRIPVIADAALEANEQFAVHLSGVGDWVIYASEPHIITIRPARVTAVHPEPGRVRVTFPTTDHQHYAVEWSTDLVAWAQLPGAENISGTGSAVDVIDATPDSCHRFYRTRLLQ